MQHHTVCVVGMGVHLKIINISVNILTTITFVNPDTTDESKSHYQSFHSTRIALIIIKLECNAKACSDTHTHST